MQRKLCHNARHRQLLKNDLELKVAYANEDSKEMV